MRQLRSQWPALLPLALCLLLALVGCGSDEIQGPETQPPDASGSPDAGDASRPDTNQPDTTTADTNQPDTTTADAGQDAIVVVKVDDLLPLGEAGAPLPTADGGAEAAVDAAPDAPFPPSHDVAIPIDGQVLFPVQLDGRTEVFNFVVDTGAGRTAVDETLLRNVANGVGTVTIDFGNGIVFQDYEVIAADLSEAINHIGVRLDGLIGQDLFQALYFGIDYRTAKGYVDTVPPSSPPPGFSQSDAHTWPYEVVQTYPVVDAQIGASTAKLIADTGSGVTILTEPFFSQAELDAGLKGYAWYTSYGFDESTIVRIASIKIGGVEVHNTWVVVVPEQHHLADVFTMLGINVNGFLGYPVYRQFFVSIKATDQSYEVFPYPNPDPLSPTEWHRVGVELVRSNGVTAVNMVFDPSDAVTQGIQVGDVLLEVDGRPVSAMELDEVRRLLRGSVGETRSLLLDRNGGR